MDKHLLLSLALPAVFLAFAGLIRSLIKGQLYPSNFYLGIDLALAALANGIINVADLGSTLSGLSDQASHGFSSKMLYNAILLAVAFGVLLVLMAMHQRLENLPEDYNGRRWRRGIWLGIVSNGLGAGSLFLFIVGRLKGAL